MAQQGSARPLRPIAPRTTPGAPVPATSGSHEEGSGKVRRAPMACTECKRRRTKCSFNTTGSPCHECALQGCECFVDESADKRRKAASRHTQEQLDYHRTFLDQLLEAIRDGDKTTVNGLVDFIRSGASKDQIRELVIQCLALEASQAFKPEVNNRNAQTGASQDGVAQDGTVPYFTPDGWH